MGEIISIASQKGGVGKTTTAVNLAACFAKVGKRTLLVDLDLQGHIAPSFKFEKYDFGDSISDLSSGDENLKDAIQNTNLPNLDFVPANIWKKDNPNLTEYFQKKFLSFKSQLKGMKKYYDFILIDCPPSLDRLTYLALAASDSVIIPIQCEYYALKSLTHLLKFIRDMKDKKNPQLCYRGFLLTMVDLRSKLQQLVHQRIQYNLKGLVFKTTIPRNNRLAEVPFRGEPIISFDRNSKGAVSYAKLAQEILHQCGTIESTYFKTEFKLAGNY